MSPKICRGEEQRVHASLFWVGGYAEGMGYSTIILYNLTPSGALYACRDTYAKLHFCFPSQTPACKLHSNNYLFQERLDMHGQICSVSTWMKQNPQPPLAILRPCPYCPSQTCCRLDMLRSPVLGYHYFPHNLRKTKIIAANAQNSTILYAMSGSKGKGVGREG